MIEKRLSPLWDAVFIAGGMVVFALCVHARGRFLFLAAGGLIVASVGLSLFIRRGSARALETAGLFPYTGKSGVYTVFGGVAGIILGGAYRFSNQVPLFPQGLQVFAFTAGCIGAAEELLYRGVLQGILRRRGLWAAIILTALAHTLYKCAVLTTFPLHEGVNLVFLAGATFFGGLGFALLREFSGSIWPAAAAHVFFDIIVYGDCLRPPWWVWSP